MKTIRIFLASSEELDYYRKAFRNLVFHMNYMYEKRGIHIKLFDWEDCDIAYNNQLKLKEYNDNARKSDMFIAMFYKQANKFTLDGFNAALDEFKHNNRPKIYVYCKDISKKKMSNDLKSFQELLWDKMQYYWCHFHNRDSFLFHFVMQLQLLISSPINELNIEDDTVTLFGLPIAKLDKLKFVSANEDYQKMCKELAALPQKIEKARLLFNRFPNDKDLEDDWQQALNRFNKLKEDLALHKQLLLNTAMRVAYLYGNHITKRIRRAIDALNKGEVKKANIILDNVEDDARDILDELRRKNEITKQERYNMFCSIEALQLKASTIMLDTQIPEDERVKIILNLYIQADEIAQDCEYDKDKYIKLLFNFATFLLNYCQSEYMQKVAERLVELYEESNGKDCFAPFEIYNCVANIYLKVGDENKANDYSAKAKK